VTFVEHQRTSLEPIGVQATAARVAWHQMTELTLMAVCESVERAVSLPASPEWERVLDFMGRLARGPVP
jgi:hypothetical protein